MPAAVPSANPPAPITEVTFPNSSISPSVHGSKMRIDVSCVTPGLGFAPVNWLLKKAASRGCPFHVTGSRSHRWPYWISDSAERYGSGAGVSALLISIEATWPRCDSR